MNLGPPLESIETNNNNSNKNNNNTIKNIIKYVAYSSQGSHTGQLDFCNWLADDNTMG